MSEIIWTPPELPEWKPSCPADYIDPCGHEFIPSARRGYLNIPVLPNLTGHPWDEVAMSYIQGLRPSSLRVVKDEETTDCQTWRVTVYLDHKDSITHISQEVEVGLPQGIECGGDLAYTLNLIANAIASANQIAPPAPMNIKSDQ